MNHASHNSLSKAIHLFATTVCFMLLFVGVATAAPATTAGRQGGQAAARRPVSSSAAIVRLEHEWLLAGQTGDVATLNRILASDMQRPYPPEGSFIGKREMVDYARSHQSTHPDTPLPQFSELHVRVYGDAAIARGILTTTDPQGKLIRKSLFTDVFIRRHGRWQAVSAQENVVSR